MADTSLIFNIIAKDKSSGTFDKIKAGAAVAGVAIGAVLMSGVSTAIEKGKLDAKLSAQLGATPAQAKEIGKLSGQVYAAGFGEDMAGVSTAIKSAAQNGLVDMDKISSETSQAVVKNLLTVGSVLEEDSDRVSSAVSQMLRTGLAKSSEEAMDILVKATQKGVNKSQDLLDTVNEYGTQFRQLGLDGTQSMGLLSQAIQAGARDSDVAADALKEFALIGVSGSKKSAAAFKAVGVDAKWAADAIGKGGPQAAKALDMTLDGLRKMKPGAQQAALATALFGTKSEDMQKALLGMDLTTASKQMDGLKGATAQAAATATSGIAGWGTLGRQFQMALVDVLSQALPAVNAVFGFMQKHSDWVKPLAAGLIALGVAIGVVTAVQWAWNAALAISPVTWIVIGIVALIAVIVLVATKTKFFQTIWKAVWDFMKAVGAWFAGPFVDFYKGGFNAIRTAFMAWWNFFKGNWTAVWNFVKAIGSWFAGPFANFFVRGWNAISAKAAWLRGRVSAIFGAVKQVAVNLWNAFNSTNTKIVNKFASVIAYFVKAPGRIRGALSGMFSGLWSGFRAGINRVIQGWNNLSFGIPGFSFAGISVPGISVGTPNIPYLASGGDVQRDGLAFLHAGERVTKKAQVTRTGPGAGSGGRSGGATITIGGSNAKVVRVLLELLREGIRDQGGDVVRVLTPR